MERTLNVDLDQLQRYIDDERDKAERAKRAEIRAILDAKLDEIEALRQSNAKAEAEERARNDPNAQAAELLYRVLSAADEWSNFIALMGRAHLRPVAQALTRIEGERAAGMKHRETIAALADRETAKAAQVADRKVQIDRELAAMGILDVAADVDA